MPGHYCATL
jgi:hypothetical protein